MTKFGQVTYLGAADSVKIPPINSPANDGDGQLACSSLHQIWAAADRMAVRTLEKTLKTREPMLKMSK